MEMEGLTQIKESGKLFFSLSGFLFYLFYIIVPEYRINPAARF